MNKIQNYINNIIYVIDQSGSMSHLKNEVVKVFDANIKHLALRSKEMDQETRVTVYLFSSAVECLVFSRDVLRMPSLAGLYAPGGSTALIDATLMAIADLKKIPELYADYSALFYVISDGQNTDNNIRSGELYKVLNNLPDNWTLAALAPDATAVSEYKRFGFPAQNISVWDATSAKGLAEMGETMKRATDTYMVARASGVRSTKSLFNLKTDINLGLVKNNLSELKSNQYELIPVHRTTAVKDYVESWTKKPFRVGSAYYMLSKSETIQGYKQVALQEKSNGKVYSGPSARKLLGLPDHEVKVSAATYDKYNVFIQSSSLNRKLIAGTQVLVLK